MVERIKVEVEFNKDFYDDMIQSMREIAEARGYEVEIGDFIQEALIDLAEELLAYEEEG